MQNDSLITAGPFASEQEVHLAASVLREHGIACSVTGDQISTTMSWYGLGARKPELVLRASDTDAAWELLAAAGLAREDRFDHLRDTAADMDWVCADCDERNASSFDECWSCGTRKPENPEQRPADTPRRWIIEEQAGESTESDDSSPYRAPAAHRAKITLTPQHGLVRRAMWSAVFSLVVPPLSFYALYLIFRCFQQGRPPRRIWLVLVMAVIAFSCAFIIGFGFAV